MNRPLGLAMLVGTGLWAIGCGVAESPAGVPASDAAVVLPSGLAALGAGVGTLSGAAEPGMVDGPRGEARFDNPVNVLVGPGGALYVADHDNSALRVVAADGRTTTLTLQAGFSGPFGMALAPDGTLYVQTDYDDRGARSYASGTLWRINVGDGSATLLARDLGRPRGLCVLPDGRVVMADNEHHVVRLFDPRTMAATVLAGSPDQSGFADGSGEAARFNRPYDVVLLGDRVIVADQNNNRLRAITLAGAVTTFAGTGEAGMADGALAQATFNRPQGLARDAAGNVYVSETGGFVLRRVTSARVETVAGTGRAGFRDGAPMEAEFFGLEGLDVSPDGRMLYVADGNRGGTEDSHRVRRVSLDAPTGQSAAAISAR